MGLFFVNVVRLLLRMRYMLQRKRTNACNRQTDHVRLCNSARGSGELLQYHP